jgi:hypothetical protein
MPGYKQEKYAPEKTEKVDTLEKRFWSDVGLSTADYIYIAAIALAYFYRKQLGQRNAGVVVVVALVLILRGHMAGGRGPAPAKEKYCSMCNN